MFLIFLAFLSSTANAATITVEPDEYDHSSLQSAIDEASPGDLIVVSDGIYHENVDLNKPLTLRGMGSKERPVLDAGGKGPAITISSDGIAIEGLVVTNSSDSGILVNSDDNVIFGVLALDNEYGGIRLEGANNNTVADNNVSHNGAAGIELEDSRQNRILFNTANENADTGIELEEASDNLIESNSVYKSGNDRIELKGSKNNRILANHVTGNMHGLCLELCSDGNKNLTTTPAITISAGSSSGAPTTT